MIPVVGSTCLFTFSTPFVALNGIYTIVKTMTFETALATGVNFVSSLYTPAGLTSADYTAAAPSFAQQIVLQIQGVGANNATILYAPLGVIAQIPDPTVTRYSDVYLAIHIGPFADETVYTWIKTQIDDLVASVTGNTDTSQFYSNPSDDQYLTTSEYTALMNTRAANIKTISPQTVQIQALLKQIATLQTQLLAYQDTFIALSSSGGAIQANIGNVTTTGMGHFGVTG